MHWRSFNFDENTETIDVYVTQIRQIATLLGYGEPQILEVFKNTLPIKIILDIIPYRRFKASSRDSKENIDQREIR